VNFILFDTSSTAQPRSGRGASASRPGLKESDLKEQEK